MKLIIQLLIIALLPMSAIAQKRSNKTCCSTTSSNSHTQVAMLAKDEGFVAAHLSPEKINFTPAKGETISFKTDGVDAKGFLVKASKPSKLYVFVFQEWWGLNDHIKKEAEDLQAKLPNVNVLALDLYDGKVATTRDSAGKLMGSASPERCAQIIKGGFSYIGKDAKVATVGWCFGGGWSLQAALIGSTQVKACVVYYGMPENDVEKLKALQCNVLGIFASQDKWINPEVVKGFEENMKKANKNLTVKMYDADHAFANPSNPQYNEKFRKEAMDLSVDFFKKDLK